MQKISPSDFLTEVLQSTHEPRDHHDGVQPENHGSVFHEEGQILTNLALVLGGDALEIGTCLGISTRYISEGLDVHGSGNVHTVDIHPEFLFDASWPRITQHTCNSAYFPCRPFKWAFIDGDHKYPGVVTDIEIALECSCNYLIFHDTSPIVESVQKVSDARKAVLDNLKESEWELFDITTHCGMIYARRRPQND